MVKYSEEELIKELQRISKEYCDGGSPRIKDMKKHGNISYMTYYDRFGSWNDSLEKLDLEPNTTPSSYTRTDDYTKNDLIKEIKRLNEKNSIPSPPRARDMTKMGSFSSNTYKRVFGSWNKAIEKADLKPRNKKWSKKQIKSKIIEYKNKYNEVPSGKDLNEEYDISYQSICRKVGNYHNFLDSLDLKYSRKKISKNVLVDEVQFIAEKIGKTPTQKEFKENSNHSIKPVIDRFGCYNNFLEEANLNKNYVVYSEEKLINEMKRVIVEFEDYPTREEFNANSDFGYWRYYNHFGSWIKALEEAGYDYDGKKMPRGEDHPLWRGGSKQFKKYGKSWLKQKKKALQRDNECCRVCEGKNSNGYFQNPDVHHISPIRYWDVEEEHQEMNHLRNLICLCRSCHSKLEGKFKGRNHEEFEKLAKNYLDIEETEEKKGIFDY